MATGLKNAGIIRYPIFSAQIHRIGGQMKVENCSSFLGVGRVRRLEESTLLHSWAAKGNSMLSLTTRSLTIVHLSHTCGYQNVSRVQVKTLVSLHLLHLNNFQHTEHYQLTRKFGKKICRFDAKPWEYYPWNKTAYSVLKDLAPAFEQSKPLLESGTRRRHKRWG